MTTPARVKSYRRRLADIGCRQVSLWLPTAAVEQLDGLVTAAALGSRAEALCLLMGVPYDQHRDQ